MAEKEEMKTICVRIPNILHKEMKTFCAKSGTSLQFFVERALSDSLLIQQNNSENNPFPKKIGSP